MLTIHWQQQQHELRRLIVRRGHEPSFDAILAQLAREHRLVLADEITLPEPGDFWIGTHPRAGWGDADAERIAWASIIEVPLALRVLQFAARRQVALRTVMSKDTAPLILQAA